MLAGKKMEEERRDVCVEKKTKFKKGIVFNMSDKKVFKYFVKNNRGFRAFKTCI